MKKHLLILICCLLIAGAVLPTITLAETSESHTTHLIAPTAIAVGGNYLYVADNVDSENDKSVILCFDITNANPIYKSSLTVDGQIENLSFGNDKLYLIMQNSVVELSVTNGSQLTQSTTYAIENVVDFAYAPSINGNSEYALTNERLMRNDEGTFNSLSGSSQTWHNVKNILTLGDYIYILHDKKCERLKGSTVVWSIDDHFSKLNLNDNSPVGIFSWGSDLGFFESNAIYFVEVNATEPQPSLLRSGFTDNILDVVSKDNRLYVLTSKNKVEIYEKSGSVFGNAIGVIGSDKVNEQAPTVYTGFTLAKSKGYPTNVIYQTNYPQSIEEITTGYKGEYVILDYDGSENCDYYYVLVGDRFGWIKKSDGATSPIDDTALQIVNTDVSNQITFNAKLTSLGKVYVYDLPCSNNQTRKLVDEIEQSGSTQTEVTILQQFKEGDVTWYLVEYQQNLRGFVKSSDVGNITAKATTDSVVTIGDKKVNATLFNAVTLHLTSDLDENSIITLDGENPVKLYSGDKVKLIKTDDEKGASLVAIIANDGAVTYGWVESQRLIEVGQITTNAIVGLCALGVALVLAGIFIAIFVKRKKQSKNK